MASRQTLLSLSFCKVDRNILMMTTVLYLCILVMVPALSVKDAIAKQRMVKEKSEKRQHIETYHWYQYDVEQKQQQQQQYEQQHQSDQHQHEHKQQPTRQKRAVDKTLCKQPTDQKEMSQEINSKLNSKEFLDQTWNNHAMSIPRGEPARRVPNSRHHRCPASLNHHESDAPLVERQLCPHYDEVLELPAGYFPPVLRKAVCKCRYCIENDAYRCFPVHTSVWVLKPAGCFFGMQRYVEETHRIATGCACAV